MPNEKIMQLVDVSHGYSKGGQDIKIFDGLNMAINSGDFVAIMGPSGSGKTTLLNLLGAIDLPLKGSVVYENESISQYSSNKLAKWRASKLGFIFQFYNLMEVLTAEQNVELPLLLTHLNSKEREQHVAAALSVVGLLDRAKHYPSELSGGQQQRVAIARAIVADPKVLLCDEPTGDLDRSTAEQVLGILQLLNKKYNKTIVMVTHDEQAAKYANKIMRIDKGEFLEEIRSGTDQQSTLSVAASERGIRLAESEAAE